MPVDVGRRQTFGAGADREPGAARILSLDGEQALDDGEWVGQRRPRESLRGEPLGEAQWTASRSTTKIRVSFGGIAGGRPADL